MDTPGERLAAGGAAPEELVGDRVVVRPFRAVDTEALWQAIDSSREHLTPWMGWARG
jgi:hypothetical protein